MSNFQLFVQLGSAQIEPGKDGYMTTTIWLKNKTIEEIKAHLAYGFSDGYEILHHHLMGVPIEIDQSLEAILNISKLLYDLPSPKDSAMAEFLKGLFRYYGGSYNGELDFSYQESGKDFIANFEECYLGMHSISNTFTCWMDREKYFPDLYACFNQYPEVAEHFDWKSFTEKLISEKKIWTAPVPEESWQYCKLSGRLAQHVFKDISDYSILT